jgi:TetR/AcrR family transcriptional regulator, regulator of cefoperazone and chloramphenicol sensitivity
MCCNKRMNSSPSAKPPARDGPPPGLFRKQRSDGAHARTQLLHTALRLFSEKGFEKTSIREIARTAEANVAAISYYFGDKAGLYRAVFTEPMGSLGEDIAQYDQPHFTLRQSLEGFFAGFLEPMRQGELVQLSTRLHFREMLEPTGLWAEEIDTGIKPAHAALVRVLCRHLGLKAADDDIHRLAFSITGLAIQMFVGRDVVDAIRPQLFADAAALERWASSLPLYAQAMVEVEMQRRKSESPQAGTGASL